MSDKQMTTNPYKVLAPGEGLRLQSGEIIVVYTPGGGHKFYEELGPLAGRVPRDPTAIAALFEKHDMTLLGPPLSDE